MGQTWWGADRVREFSPIWKVVRLIHKSIFVVCRECSFGDGRMRGVQAGAARIGERRGKRSILIVFLEVRCRGRYGCLALSLEFFNLHREIRSERVRGRRHPYDEWFPVVWATTKLVDVLGWQETKERARKLSSLARPHAHPSAHPKSKARARDQNLAERRREGDASLRSHHGA